MGAKNAEMIDSMSIVSTTNLLNKMLDLLKIKDKSASEVADLLLNPRSIMSGLARATILVSTSHPSTKVFLDAQDRYINHKRRRYPNPRLTKKRQTQMIQAYFRALSAYFGSWDYIEKATLMDGMSKMPTTFVPEEFREFMERLKGE